MKKTYLLLFVFLAIVFLLVLGEEKKQNSSENDIADISVPDMGDYLIINDNKLLIDIADTAEKRTRGLSGRPNLGENEGLFFIFEVPGRFSFWMKDMNFPIDIIWIDAEFKVVDITKNAVPESFPKTFEPRTPVLYVLETIAGWADKNGIKMGDKVLFSRQ